MILYWLLKPLLFLLNHLPLKALDAIGVFFGNLLWIISKDRRHVAVVNAKIIGVENPENIAKQSFKNTFKAYMEIFYAKRVDSEFVKKYVTIEGRQYFEDTRKNYKEYVLVGAHFGPWGMLANMVSVFFGCKVVTIGRASKNKSMERILDELRTSENIEYITHRGAIAKLTDYLADGYAPGVYLDHTATPKDCVNVDFFGYKTPTIAGIPAFAARKNRPILMFFGAYVENGYKIIIYPPIFPDKSLKPRERIEQTARDINKIYEDIFRKYPDQWYLIHRRFKRVEEEDGTISDRIYR